MGRFTSFVWNYPIPAGLCECSRSNRPEAYSCPQGRTLLGWRSFGGGTVAVDNSRRQARQDRQIKEVADELVGAIYSDSALNAADQNTKVQAVDQLRSTALGEVGADGTAPSPDDRSLAQSKLQAMGRAAEIPSLDTAAKALAGATALLTGLFVALGFQSGDFIRMIRDFWSQSFLFMLLAGLAIILGTFAVVIDAYRSQRNLWIERFDVYLGIVCAATAFGLLAWGLSQGASAGPARPTISASFDTSSNTPVLKASASSSDVPRSEHLTETVWGKDAQGWTVLSNVATGPAPDGSATANIAVDNVTKYSEIEAAAALSSTDTPVPTTPPSNCSSETSCDFLVGFAPSP
jgi:hypothetical protein